ncbi:type II toxin-antitoxin system PemK/MazF family toxin [Gracilimonas sediminicola]|uniref:Type II toxin-antitoxin system PemK/MazF family toxin n=1 Tax=Gracilimonas sediminicola TaxID=2952158 RepID=A0A9X2L2A5_9BACT|nr:type II toxin-antitoxin system PemK/MazF family toxin [Gracilimonas sediminicola]MCP9290945.1 type II toxin-antitoxin system PemK/MazF family toxin [Gracilimonas sediminicola]
METFVRGDVVVVPFPFSDLSQSKRRPALVIRNFGEDLLLAQITSKTIKNDFAVEIKEADFNEGSLKVVSNVRPEKLFTCSKNLILYKAGSLSKAKFEQIIKKITEIVSGT